MKNVYDKLRFILTDRDFKSIKWLILFSMLVSVVEVVGVSIIMPFVAVSSDFTIIDSNKYYSYLYHMFSFDSHLNFVLAFGAALVLFYVFRSFVGLYYVYVLERFSLGKQHGISMALFKNIIKMPYRDFTEENSSLVTKSIVSEVWNFVTVIKSGLIIVSEVFLVLFMYMAMLYANYKVTLALTLFVLIGVFVVSKKVSGNIKYHGENRENSLKNIFEIINSTFGNFKIIKLHPCGDGILDRFSGESLSLSRSNIISTVLTSVPRMFLEALGFLILVIGIMLFVWRSEEDISSYLPLIAFLILGLYRLLPSVSKILNGYHAILFNLKAVDIVYKGFLYGEEKVGYDPVLFDDKIRLKNVSFGYSAKELILENVNLSIRKGDRVAVYGASGSGKSTLVDMIIGVYSPLKGGVSVDDINIDSGNVGSFRGKVGYIPQNVYLFDGTVAENVVFEFDYDENRVKEVLQQANILDFLEEKGNGISTVVGENGVKLSGGQRQRIAIARALYNNPEILVLDEATSALDNETEAKIMSEIYDISRNKTLIIITHRMETVNECEMVYKVENRKVEKVK